MCDLGPTVFDNDVIPQLPLNFMCVISTQLYRTFDICFWIHSHYLPSSNGVLLYMGYSFSLYNLTDISYFLCAPLGYAPSTTCGTVFALVFLIILHSLCLYNRAQYISTSAFLITMRFSLPMGERLLCIYTFVSI